MKRLLRYLWIPAVIVLVAAGFFAGYQAGKPGTPAIDYACAAPAEQGEVCYVIGHKSPDTDTVASAIAYAGLMNRLGKHCVPAVSGKLNNETRLALETFGAETPMLLENAAGKTMILVDHSTYTQTVDGMEDAGIVGIVDHHGLGSVTTAAPVYIRDMAVGATATIVYVEYRERGVDPDKSTAGLLASAILSDTLNLTSATTTPLDRAALAELADIAGIADIDAYYALLSEAAASYDNMTAEEIFYSDYKEYSMSGADVGIACVNAGADDLDALCSQMTAFMAEVYDRQEMGHLFVMVHDRDRDQTVLLCHGEGAAEVMEKAFGSSVLTPGVSRKGYVVPALEEVYKTAGAER